MSTAAPAKETELTEVSVAQTSGGKAAKAKPQKTHLANEGKGAEQEVEGGGEGGGGKGEAGACCSATKEQTILRIVLAAIAGAGLIVGFVFFAVIYYQPGRVESQFATGAVPMWGGFGAAWVFGPIAVWWLAPYFNENHTKCGLLAAAVLSGLQGLCGVLGFFGWAACSGEVGGAFAVLILWCVPAVLSILLSVKSLKKCRAGDPQVHAVTTGTAEEEGGDKPSCCCCKCNCRVAVISLGFVVVFVGLLFSAGVAVNGLASAATQYAPLGSIHTLTVVAHGREQVLDMHLYCTGTADTAGKPTIVLEHGGGSNSVALTGLQNELVDNHGFRVCVYDRLGYGYTPSASRQLNNNDVAYQAGRLLHQLLWVSGEDGPFACVGHSAGASACLDFAIFNQYNGTSVYSPHDEKFNVTAILSLDGYPDVIRAGSFYPALFEPGPPPYGVSTMVFAFFAGATGFTRGIVGATNDKFVPQEHAARYTALYAQERFWHSQYWDVRTDAYSGHEGYLYSRIPGAFQNSSVYIDYGSQLEGVRVTWIPAYDTVSSVCTANRTWNEQCCDPAQRADWCADSEAHSAFYRAQADLYAATIGTMPGEVVVGPEDSAHDFVWEAEYVPWIAATVADRAV